MSHHSPPRLNLLGTHFLNLKTLKRALMEES